MLVFRLLVLLLAGFTLFSDEQERFICNTIQPGCSNVCFDVFAPVSVFRLWLFHLILLFLPHVVFATYVMHEVLSRPSSWVFFYDRSRGSSPFSLENSNSSREVSLHKAPLHETGGPRFYCAYLQAVILRILLEAVFGAGQFYLFGLSFPKSFLCYESPCTSGVECYVSRRTEKTLMLNFMLCVASLSILLSLVDLASSMKAMVTWRRKRQLHAEEISKGQQTSMFTSTTIAEEKDVLPTRRPSLSGSSKNCLRDEKPRDEPLHTKTSQSEKKPEGKDPQADASPTPVSTPVPSHVVLNGHPRSPLSLHPDMIPTSNPKVPPPLGVRNMGQCSPAGGNSGQQCDSSDAKDRRAWV